MPTKRPGVARMGIVPARKSGHTADRAQNAQVNRDTACEHEHPFGFLRMGA